MIYFFPLQLFSLFAFQNLSGWVFGGILCILIAAIWKARNLIRIWSKIKKENNALQETLMQEKSAQKIKAQFIKDISFELHHSLQLIQPSLEAATKTHPKSTQMQQQQMAVHGTERISYLIHQLMNYKNIETDYLQLRTMKGNFIPFIYQIYLSFREHAHFHNIHYYFECSSQELILYYDREKLEKVFFNLLKNAFKLTPKGGVIKLTVKEQKKSNDQFPLGSVEITIMDEGIGLSSRSLGLIFNAETEKDTGEKREYEMEVGLSIAKKLVELHKGYFEAKSDLGIGSTFSVHLPMGHKHLDQDQKLEGIQHENPSYHSSFPISEKVNHSVEEESLTRYKTESKSSPLIPSQLNAKDQKFLANIQQIVEDQMKDPEFNIEYLGKQVGFSRVHLYRKIKGLTNMSATAYVRSLRMKRAAHLLRENTLLNINEISYEVGIQDPSYFRQCFKKMYGVPPSAYREGVKMKEH